MAKGLSAPNLVLKASGPPSLRICWRRFCCLVANVVAVVPAEEVAIDSPSFGEESNDAAVAADIHKVVVLLVLHFVDENDSYR
jgi:hypothetical protein